MNEWRLLGRRSTIALTCRCINIVNFVPCGVVVHRRTTASLSQFSRNRVVFNVVEFLSTVRRIRLPLDLHPLPIPVPLSRVHLRLHRPFTHWLRQVTSLPCGRASQIWRNGREAYQSAQGKVDDDDVVRYAIRVWRRPEALTLFTFYKAIIFPSYSRTHVPHYTRTVAAKATLCMLANNNNCGTKKKNIKKCWRNNEFPVKSAHFRSGDRRISNKQQRQQQQRSWPHPNT